MPGGARVSRSVLNAFGGCPAGGRSTPISPPHLHLVLRRGKYRGCPRVAQVSCVSDRGKPVSHPLKAVPAKRGEAESPVQQSLLPFSTGATSVPIDEKGSLNRKPDRASQ